MQCVDTACPPPPPLICQGDVDFNGAVNFEDILLVLNAWGPCGDPCPEDIDQDGIVGFSEILLILNAFGGLPASAASAGSHGLMLFVRWIVCRVTLCG